MSATIGGGGVSSGGGSGGLPPNSYVAAANNAGNSTFTRGRPNTLVNFSVGGAARTSKIILNTAGAIAADEMTVRTILPATADIILDFRNGAVGGAQLLPALTFTGQTFTTDGITTSATFRFGFDGAAWFYIDSQIPA
jgi:hypothetical protein